MSRRETVVVGWLLLAAAGMNWLPPDMQTALRLTAGDAVRPGCQLWAAVQGNVSRHISPRHTAAHDASAAVERLRQELEAAKFVNRQLQILLAQQRETAKALQPPLFVASSDRVFERLAGPQLIDAAVLGESHAASWRKGGWLNQGKTAGLLEEMPIVSSSELLLDLGRDAELQAEDAVLLGRAVIGKVHHAGRWTSTFLLVTDRDFRGRAQIVHHTPDGYVFGAKGVLTGDGDARCRLSGIPASATVNVGDAVYTAERDGLLPTPLYYGEVVEAALEEHAQDWTIVIRPMDTGNLTEVQVLRTQVNSRRLSAN